MQVHAMALRCQVRIEPQRRGYDTDDEPGLRALFGDRDRWPQTLKPFQWMQCHTTVQGFTGATEVDLALPCTYDFDVTGSRLLHGVGSGTLPLSLMFSGTVFTRGEHGFGVLQVPWDSEARYDLPVRVWQDMIAGFFPHQGWIRLDHDVLSGARRLPRPARSGVVGGDRQPAARRGPLPGRGRAAVSPVSADRLQQARTVADAVLYEGYLLYPYRASSDKNRARWQFGVLGPPGAADRGLGEPDSLTMHTILTGVADGSSVDVHLRFLQLQHRQVARRRGARRSRPCRPGAAPS